VIIIIADDVFAAVLKDPAKHLDLMSLMRLGATGRHRIELDPLFEPQADRPRIIPRPRAWEYRAPVLPQHNPLALARR
jgi:hypothetical protein